ncbi:hypothetical protein [Rhodococcus sp. ANT_H53B]|uniref:hypothetical protein n=1 Tax=Rhodococcus sp. ANT_H53B TaxID=2597357 RepID=UPI0011EF465B|nr:hypothetical protein [Rhodococcus sp. ANT_H53B]KAA0921844.1 hypothetical protein FQ188_23400 [Rhodococcus sp. ANT_H53B]
MTTNFRIAIGTKGFTVVDDDQEASDLLRLAGHDPKSFDLFLITEHGLEERIEDGQIVNLHDDDKFVAREKVRFTIDGEHHSSYDDDQTAAALLRRGGVDPAKYDLARVGRAETFRDDQMVKIADGDEFVTARRVGGVA